MVRAQGFLRGCWLNTLGLDGAYAESDQPQMTDVVPRFGLGDTARLVRVLYRPQSPII